MTHVCDCGRTYAHPDQVIACATSNHTSNHGQITEGVGHPAPVDKLGRIEALLHQIARAQVGIVDMVAAMRLDLHNNRARRAAAEENERLAAKRAAANHPFNPGTQENDR